MGLPAERLWPLLLSFSPDWVWLVSDADPCLHCASPWPRGQHCRKTPAPRWKHFPLCIMCMKIIRTLCNQNAIRPEIHATCTKELLCLLVDCVAFRSQVRETWWKLESPCEPSLNKTPLRCFHWCGNGVHFSDCFFYDVTKLLLQVRTEWGYVWWKSAGATTFVWVNEYGCR